MAVELTPKAVFIRELAKVPGWTYRETSEVEEEGGCADFEKKEIRLGFQLPEDRRYIVGLHELGHVHTFENFKLHCFQNWKRPTTMLMWQARYANEICAWAWAESVMCPGYDADFAWAKERGLDTYREGVNVAEREEHYQELIIKELIRLFGKAMKK